MYFLVDYENVCMSGLQGVEYTDANDNIVLFCNAGQTIRQDVLDLLTKSGAEVEYVSLVKKGKNGLDFYIACRVGELIAGGIHNKIIIISRDNGYGAIIDYCKKRGFNNVYRSINIENALKTLGGERQKQICYRTKTLNLCTAIDLINQEKQYRMEVVKHMLPVKDFCSVDDIQKIIKEANGKREVYLSLLKKYGKNTGTKAYRCIRDLY